MNRELDLRIPFMMQSFAPLFLVIAVRYFRYELFMLIGTFVRMFQTTPTIALGRAIHHDMFCTLLLEIACIVWVGYSVYCYACFRDLQRADYVSAGESLSEIKDISDSGVNFFVAYIMPLMMDDLNTPRGIIVFMIMMLIMGRLLYVTRLYYQNPVLTLLGYRLYSFRFETTRNDELRDRACIAITRDELREECSIKRQNISSDLFLIYYENR